MRNNKVTWSKTSKSYQFGEKFSIYENLNQKDLKVQQVPFGLHSLNFFMTQEGESLEGSVDSLHASHVATRALSDELPN